jgi:hypothetical protein
MPNMDTYEGFSPEEAAAGSTNSLLGHIEGAGHAVAGAWDVLNGSMNHALSSGLRLIGDNEDADMSDRFMQQRWDSATEHFKQMHKDFDGTADGATDSLDALGDSGQEDWAGDGASYDGDSDPSSGEGESDDTDDYSDDYSDEGTDDDTQGSFDAASDGDTGDGGDDGDEGE